MDEDTQDDLEEHQPLSYAQWLYHRTCERKIAYESIGPASRARLRMQERYDCSMVPYQCRFCGQWHLSKREERPPRE